MHGEVQMKTDGIYKLHEDLLRISKQIGILPEEIPSLVTSRPAIHAIKLASPRIFHVGNDVIDKVMVNVLHRLGSSWMIMYYIGAGPKSGLRAVDLFIARGRASSRLYESTLTSRA